MKMKFCIEANGEGLVSVCIEGKAIELSALLATVMDQDGMIRELITLYMVQFAPIKKKVACLEFSSYLQAN